MGILHAFFGLPLRCPLCCCPPALAGILLYTRNFLWVLVGFFGLSSRCLCALHCSRAPLSLSSPALAGIQKYTRNFCRFLWVGIGSCRFLWAFFTLSSGFLRGALALPLRTVLFVAALAVPSLRSCGYTFVYPRHREELHLCTAMIRSHGLCNSVAIYLCLSSSMIRAAYIIALRNEV